MSNSTHMLHISPQVSRTRPEEITFRIEQTMKVGVLQPAAVSVYEYYDRESKNPLRNVMLLQTFSDILK